MQWLTKHAPLVKSITASRGVHTSTVHGLPWEQHVAAVQQLLQQALQVAVLQAAVTAGKAAVACAPAAPQQQQLQQQQQQQQRGLRLSSFATNCLVTPDTLAALPAHSLTHLDIDLEHSKPMDGTVLSAASAQLSSLQHLSLVNESQVSVAGRCLLGLAQLRQLTLLKLCGNWGD
jgi:hypothetical protein